jgi:hypothetical protein
MTNISTITMYKNNLRPHLQTQLDKLLCFHHIEIRNLFLILLKTIRKLLLIMADSYRAL